MMSEERTKRAPALLSWPVFFLVLAAGVYFFYLGIPPGKVEEWGGRGDAVAPFLNVCALFALLWSLKLQGDALAEQRKELALQRQELAESREVLREQAKSQAEQVAAQRDLANAQREAAREALRLRVTTIIATRGNVLGSIAQIALERARGRARGHIPYVELETTEIEGHLRDCLEAIDEMILHNPNAAAESTQTDEAQSDVKARTR